MSKKLRISHEKLEQIVQDQRTPFYLYLEECIKKNARKLHDTFSWAPGFRNYFAIKACPNPFIVKLLAAQGMGADCSSSSELDIADMAGITEDRIMLSSNSTTKRLLHKATARNAIINLDDITHLPHLINMTNGRPETVCFRYNPGDAIQGTAIIGKGTEAKFGNKEETITEAYRKARDITAAHSHTPMYGIHTMAGSNRLDTDYFRDVAGVMFNLVAHISEELGIRFDFVNLGGGIGIPYRPEEKATDLRKLSVAIREQYRQKIEAKGLDPIDILMENGRSITGPYGYFVTKVLRVEEKHKSYIRTDGNEAQFPRPGIYGAYHHAIVLGKEDQPHDHKYDIAGGLCENWKLAQDRWLPKVEPGDTIVFMDAGAHCWAMSMNYNGTPKSREILLKSSGKTEMIRYDQPENKLLEDVPLPFLGLYKPSKKRG